MQFVCGEISSLFLLVVRPILLSYPYRDVDRIAWQLACHRKYRGMLPWDGLSASATSRRVRLSVFCVASKDGQAMVTPNLITSFFIIFTHFLLFVCKIWPHKHLFFQSISLYYHTCSSESIGAIYAFTDT